MSTFIFDSYEFNVDDSSASFHYAFDDGRKFTETITFAAGEVEDDQLLDRALFLSFVLIGTSYFKTFPTPNVQFNVGSIDDWQANFLNNVYQEGLSQFAFENNLTRSDLAQFSATAEHSSVSTTYDKEGILLLQSGGKDSLLVSALLDGAGKEYTPWYLSSGQSHPSVLDELGSPLQTAVRNIDKDSLIKAKDEGGLNGHVPITYIVQSLAIIQALLLGKNTVAVSIAHEGEEPHTTIGDLSVTHQWSKTWQAEQMFADYVQRYISPDIFVGSPLRSMSELKVAKLFTENAWEKFGHKFSSCNRANYMQGADNQHLQWCGECPKCANSFLLFAPYVDTDELKSLFGGQDLFSKPLLTETFKGLLGIDGVMKPFECVGEIDELRYAYIQAQQKGGYDTLPFDVPVADFDPEYEYLSQPQLHLF